MTLKQLTGKTHSRCLSCRQLHASCTGFLLLGEGCYKRCRCGRSAPRGLSAGSTSKGTMTLQKSHLARRPPSRSPLWDCCCCGGDRPA